MVSAVPVSVGEGERQVLEHRLVLVAGAEVALAVKVKVMDMAE